MTRAVLSTFFGRCFLHNESRKIAVPRLLLGTTLLRFGWRLCSPIIVCSSQVPSTGFVCTRFLGDYECSAVAMLRLRPTCLFLKLSCAPHGTSVHSVLLPIAPRMDWRFICCFCFAVLLVDAGLLRTGMVQKPDVTAGRDDADTDGPPPLW